MEKDGKSGAGKEIAQEGLAADAEGYSPYVNSEHGVSLVYPEEWKKSEGYMGTIVSFLCPDDATGRTSLNLLVQEVPPGITLEDYSAESLGQMKQMMADTEFKVWDGDMFAQAGKRMQFVADMGPFTVKVFQAWTVAKDQAYIITYSAPAETHDLQREHVEKVIASTKFVKAEPKEKPIELLCLKHYENPTHAFRLRSVLPLLLLFYFTFLFFHCCIILIYLFYSYGNHLCVAVIHGRDGDGEGQRGQSETREGAQEGQPPLLEGEGHPIGRRHPSARPEHIPLHPPPLLRPSRLFPVRSPPLLSLARACGCAMVRVSVRVRVRVRCLVC